MTCYSYIGFDGVPKSITPNDQSSVSCRRQIVLLFRPSFDIRVVDLPRRGRETRSVLELKLPSLYPGNPDETVFDYKRTTGSEAIVFVTTEEVFSECRNQMPGACFVLPYSIVKPAVDRFSRNSFGKTVCYFCWDDWIEVLFFDGPAVQSSSVYQDISITDMPDLLVNQIPEEFEGSTLLFYCAEAEKESLQSAFPDHDQSLIFAVEDEIQKVRPRQDSLFALSNKNRIGPRVMSVALAFVLAFSIYIIENRVAYQKESLSDLEFRIQDIEQTRALLLKADALELEYQALKERKPLNLYRFLAEASVILGEKTSIQQFNIDARGSFQLEGIGKESFSIMREFESADQFSQIRLPRTFKDVNTGQERFSLSGAYHE